MLLSMNSIASMSMCLCKVVADTQHGELQGSAEKSRLGGGLLGLRLQQRRLRGRARRLGMPQHALDALEHLPRQVALAGRVRRLPRGFQPARLGRLHARSLLPVLPQQHLPWQQATAWATRHQSLLSVRSLSIP